MLAYKIDISMTQMYNTHKEVYVHNINKRTCLNFQTITMFSKMIQIANCKVSWKDNGVHYTIMWKFSKKNEKYVLLYHFPYVVFTIHP